MHVGCSTIISTKGKGRGSGETEKLKNVENNNLRASWEARVSVKCSWVKVSVLFSETGKETNY